MLRLLIIVILIIYIFNLKDKLDILERKNKKLKNRILELENILSMENISKSNNLNDNEKIIDTQIEENNISKEKIDKTSIVPKVENKKSIEEIEKEKKLKEKQDMERKNSNILAVGSICIVLAAIVFLMSTWNSLHNIIKTAVIFLLTGVFLGASKIAKDKFKLQKTSNTFFYISMAYIPICLLACSFFGLFGEYLSISGEGNFLYLTLAMLFTAGLYYINYKERNDITFFYGSILAQVSSVVLFSLIFETSIRIIGINLLCYNVLLLLFSKSQSLNNALKIFYMSIPYIVGICILPIFFISSFYTLLLIILLIVNFLLIYSLKDKNSINFCIINTLIYTFGFYFSFIFIKCDISLKLAFSIVYTIGSYIIERVIFDSSKDTYKSNSSIVLTVLTIGIMFCISISERSDIIKPFVLSALEFLVLISAYSRNEEEEIKGFISFCSISTFLISGIGIIHVFKLPEISYHILGFIALFYGELIRNENWYVYRKISFCVSHLYIIVSYLILAIYKDISASILMFSMLFIAYLYSFKVYSKMRVFKYLIYISAQLLVYSIFNKVGIVGNIIPVMFLFIVMITENKIEKLKDDASFVYFIIAEISAFYGLFMLESTIGDMLLVLSCAYFILQKIDNENDFVYKIISEIALIPVIFFRDYPVIIMLFSTIILTVYSLKEKRVSVDTIFSAIYLLITLPHIDNNYINEILLLVWTVPHLLFVSDEKMKDLFKLLILGEGFLLYQTALTDLGLCDDYMAFTLIGVLVVAILLIKMIIKKYTKDLDSIEVITYVVLYLFALVNYKSEFDGMIFISFVIMILMMSYIKKYGIVFITSLIAIVVNILALTREFWLSLPWWLYLLVVGIVLIAFAIKNEANENKNKINIENVFKELRDKIEKK